MNRLAQALHYLQKVFDLKTRLRAVQDQRPQAKIQTLSVLLCLFLGVFTRVSSYLDSPIISIRSNSRPHLFQPITIKSVTLRNCVSVSPRSVNFAM
jgi:hypothetical protein